MVEHDGQSHQNGSHNGAKNRFGELNFWFLLKLVFAQHYKGFAWFSWFMVTSGRPKNHKKRLRKINVEKHGPKPLFLKKKIQNICSKWGPLWTPNSLSICAKSVFFRTWCPRAPKEGPRVPKASPRAPKGVQKWGKEHQKETKSRTKLYEKKKTTTQSDADCLMFSVACLLPEPFVPVRLHTNLALFVRWQSGSFNNIV